MINNNFKICILAAIVLSILSVSAYADYSSAMKNYKDKNYAEAMAEFKRSAVLGHKISQFNIGVMYLQGEGVDKDIVEAYAWLAVSATDKNPDRMQVRDAVMGQMTESQKDAAIDRMNQLFSEIAVESKKLVPVLISEEQCKYKLHLVKMVSPEYPKSKQGNGDAIADLDFNVDRVGAVRDFSVSYTTNHDYDDSILKVLGKWRYSPVTANGKPVEAVSVRLRIVFQPYNSEPNTKELKRYANELKDKAKQDDPVNMFTAAYIGELVRELNIDRRDINTWFYKAAQAGLPQAEYQIGKSLFRGEGCEQDTYKGLRWLTMAAEERSAEAQYFLGISLISSDKVQEDRAQGIDWLSKAASGHHEKAMMRLAWILATDKDDKVRDPARALTLINEVYKNYADKLRSNETLAAAQAANGKFDDAVKSQMAALKEAKSIAYPLNEVQARLTAYQNKQQWIE